MANKRVVIDRFKRRWPFPINELCKVCGQPDSCGDCNHKRLSDSQVAILLGKKPKTVGSMPLKPALGRGHVWTRSKMEKVFGRWVIVGWGDTLQPTLGLVTEIGGFHDVEVLWFWQSTLYPVKHGYDAPRGIDDPAQVIEIGERVFPPEDFIEKLPRRVKR